MRAFNGGAHFGPKHFSHLNELSQAFHPHSNSCGCYCGSGNLSSGFLLSLKRFPPNQVRQFVVLTIKWAGAKHR